ncbi:MAG: glycine zipper 2TM domain-containing protein [Alphaproteobacteria bacterium]|nr:glycine zipper 2TM domain-containing protein [Alphaproteobacteria bacterium]
MNIKSNVTLIVSLIIGSLMFTGCDDFSGDQYSAAQVKSVSNVSYGTIVGIRSVKARVNQGTTGGAAGTLGGGVLGGVVGNALGGSKGTLIGAGIGALGGAAAGYAIGNRNVNVKEYTIQVDNGNTIAITQKEPPVLSVNQRVAIHFDASGNGRVIPA